MFPLAIAMKLLRSDADTRPLFIASSTSLSTLDGSFNSVLTCSIISLSVTVSESPKTSIMRVLSISSFLSLFGLFFFSSDSVLTGFQPFLNSLTAFSFAGTSTIDISIKSHSTIVHTPLTVSHLQFSIPIDALRRKPL